MNVTEMKGSGQYLVEHVIIISFFFSLKSTHGIMALYHICFLSGSRSRIEEIFVIFS